MLSYLWYFVAALAEMSGCYMFWLWLRLGKSALWVTPGILLLMLFASILTRLEVESSGRVYAAYGGVYIFSSLLWLWLAEGIIPTRWDIVGVTICLFGSLVIIGGSVMK